MLSQFFGMTDTLPLFALYSNILETEQPAVLPLLLDISFMDGPQCKQAISVPSDVATAAAATFGDL